MSWPKGKRICPRPTRLECVFLHFFLRRKEQADGTVRVIGSIAGGMDRVRGVIEARGSERTLSLHLLIVPERCEGREE